MLEVWLEAKDESRLILRFCNYSILGLHYLGITIIFVFKCKPCQTYRHFYWKLSKKSSNLIKKLRKKTGQINW